MLEAVYGRLHCWAGALVGSDHEECSMLCRSHRESAVPLSQSISNATTASLPPYTGLEVLFFSWQTTSARLGRLSLQTNAEPDSVSMVMTLVYIWAKNRSCLLQANSAALDSKVQQASISDAALMRSALWARRSFFACRSQHL